MPTNPPYDPPRYTHDDPSAIYLGHYKKYDLYLHLSRADRLAPESLFHQGTTVVARDGDDHFILGLPYIWLLDPLRITFLRAVEQGFLRCSHPKFPIFLQATYAGTFAAYKQAYEDIVGTPLPGVFSQYVPVAVLLDLFRVAAAERAKFFAPVALLCPHCQRPDKLATVEMRRVYYSVRPYLHADGSMKYDYSGYFRLAPQVSPLPEQHEWYCMHCDAAIEHDALHPASAFSPRT